MSETIDITKVPVRKLHTGAVMPAMGLGTFGSDKYSPDQISEAVYGAVKSGYRMLDCASVYQNEHQIGEVLGRLFSENVVSREELFITSKVWNDQHREVRKACEKSLSDLGLSYIDLYFVHWPFPNYHAPGCDGDSRNPDSKPFSVDEFMDTWKQCEELVDAGLVKAIGMSNMTISKLEAVLPLCRIKPAALEMECHPSFQQQDLFDYAVAHDIVPIGFCPIGSPSRPERDRTAEDVADTELPEVVTVAKNHGIHPAVVCLKWAVQRGMCPIPFSVKEPQYISNLKCTTVDPLTDDEMELLKKAERNCRLVKGQVFLWPGAEDWQELWQ
ncbi:aldo/keto reductase [Butyrivibrio sp. CB08]|uniref:aldo/keto reductase family protein n=1 Tax=Butyrivibrio sp. CB08 TaxID=2364879 RepID=UPI000EAA1B43|nr:aldo/keto reductase [Butyrivibrio sp. CB08]RKM59871.1 aldo/keto reductase [Butyrivibrio sp. CB08]